MTLGLCTIYFSAPASKGLRTVTDGTKITGLTMRTDHNEIFSTLNAMHECFHAVVADIPVARVAQVMSKPNSHA